MENTSPTLTFKDEITVDMKPARIARLVDRALAQVPGAVGVNNHTGSKFTQDPHALECFLREVKKSGLFFVDSRTTPNTKGYEVAHTLDIPAAERGLFLDNDKEPDAIRRRFREAMRLAREQGQFIAICHFRPNTAGVLVDMLPELEANGIQLVHASELVQ
jgi:polysaccharide deacetylase 2 family uncharacterized protein YibQ